MRHARLSTLARIIANIAKGLVHYCSQQRGAPAKPLREYSKQDLVREYDTRKSCAPYCTVSCVQQVGYMDNWRRPQGGVGRLPPEAAHAAPAPSAP